MRRTGRMTTGTVPTALGATSEAGRAVASDFEERLGVERGHAAGARRRDRLAIDVVGDVAGREHARDARRRRVAFGAALDRM